MRLQRDTGQRLYILYTWTLTILLSLGLAMLFIVPMVVFLWLLAAVFGG